MKWEPAEVEHPPPAPLGIRSQVGTAASANGDADGDQLKGADRSSPL